MKRFMLIFIMTTLFCFGQENIAGYADNWQATQQEVLIDGVIKKVSAIYVDVNLKPYQLAEAPIVFTSLEGKTRQFEAIGVNSIYRLTKDGFRVYIYYRNGITPEMAKSFKWRLAWLAFKVRTKE